MRRLRHTLMDKEMQEDADEGVGEVTPQDETVESGETQDVSDLTGMPPNDDSVKIRHNKANANSTSKPLTLHVTEKTICIPRTKPPVSDVYTVFSLCRVPLPRGRHLPARWWSFGEVRRNPPGDRHTDLARSVPRVRPA